MITGDLLKSLPSELSDARALPIVEAALNVDLNPDTPREELVKVADAIKLCGDLVWMHQNWYELREIPSYFPKDNRLFSWMYENIPESEVNKEESSAVNNYGFDRGQIGAGAVARYINNQWMKNYFAERTIGATAEDLEAAAVEYVGVHDVEPTIFFRRGVGSFEKTYEARFLTVGIGIPRVAGLRLATDDLIVPSSESFSFFHPDVIIPKDKKVVEIHPIWNKKQSFFSITTEPQDYVVGEHGNDSRVIELPCDVFDSVVRHT